MDPVLDPTEQQIAIAHRHPIFLVPAIAASMVLVVALAYIAYAAGRYADSLGMLTALVIPLIAIVGLVVVLILGLSLLLYSDNRLILTDQHLVVVVRNSLFSRGVSHLTLDRVQDVSFKKTGILQTVFNYGTLEVETAGEHENFEFLYAPNPGSLSNLITDTHEKYSHPEAPTP